MENHRGFHAGYSKKRDKPPESSKLALTKEINNEQQHACASVECSKVGPTIRQKIARRFTMITFDYLWAKARYKVRSECGK